MALRGNREVLAARPRPRPRQASRRTPPRRSAATVAMAARAASLPPVLPPRRGRPRWVGHFIGDRVEQDRFGLRNGDLHRRERRTWGATNRLYTCLHPRPGRRRWCGERNKFGYRRRRRYGRQQRGCVRRRRWCTRTEPRPWWICLRLSQRSEIKCRGAHDSIRPRRRRGERICKRYGRGQHRVRQPYPGSGRFQRDPYSGRFRLRRDVGGFERTAATI